MHPQVFTIGSEWVSIRSCHFFSIDPAEAIDWLLDRLRPWEWWKHPPTVGKLCWLVGGLEHEWIMTFGNFMIPTDFKSDFQRGRSTSKQSVYYNHVIQHFSKANLGFSRPWAPHLDDLTKLGLRIIFAQNRGSSMVFIIFSYFPHDDMFFWRYIPIISHCHPFSESDRD